MFNLLKRTDSPIPSHFSFPPSSHDTYSKAFHFELNLSLPFTTFLEKDQVGFNEYARRYFEIAMFQQLEKSTKPQVIPLKKIDVYSPKKILFGNFELLTDLYITNRMHDTEKFKMANISKNLIVSILEIPIGIYHLEFYKDAVDRTLISHLRVCLALSTFSIFKITSNKYEYIFNL